MAKNSVLDIKNILEEYSVEVQEAIAEEVERIAKEGAEELKATSPKRTGKYAKGWKVKTTKGKGYISSTIYNSNAGLTQLLERTHATKNGGSVTPKSAGHIQRVEDKVIAEYTNALQNIIQNGGK